MSIQFLTPIETPAPERCDCLPLSPLHAAMLQEQQETGIDDTQLTTATAELNSALRTILNSIFPCSTPLSVLHLHISQLEHVHITQQSVIFHKRQRYHAPASLLEQVLANVRRAIRVNDLVLTHDGTGAAILFPGVDQQGAYSILERVDRNISLLQAETVIPPLKQETDILVAIGSYPEPGDSLEQLLFHTGVTACRLTLRPAILPHLWSTPSNTPSTEIPTHTHQPRKTYERPLASPGPASILVPTATHTQVQSVPFMQLPAELPTRLKHLIPYQAALTFRCAPVGRDHHCLTVAMADPTNTDIIQALREITGMTIFPVSCEPSALDTLLAHQW